MQTPASERATVITAGLDLVDETRSLSEQLKARLSKQTPLYKAVGSPLWRARSLGRDEPAR
jgi:hypothetical protein